MIDHEVMSDDPAEAQEIQDWIESLDDVLQLDGTLRASEILSALRVRAQKAGISAPVNSRTPSINTIPRGG